MIEDNNTHPNQSETANTNQPIADAAQVVSDSVNAIPEQETSTQENNERTQIVPEPIKVIIDGDKRKSTAPRIANIIAAVSVIISAIMFVYTFRLFNETKRANNIADSNYHLAKTAFESSDKSSKDNYDLANRSFESSNEDAKKRFKIDSGILKAQIRSLKEQGDRFEIENKPILTIIPSIIYLADSSNKMVLRYNYILINHTKMAAIQKGFYLRIWNGKKKDVSTDTVKFNQEIRDSKFLSKNEIIVNNMSDTMWVNDERIDIKALNIFKEEKYLYYYGKILYTNAYDDTKQYEYSFIIMIDLLVPGRSSQISSRYYNLYRKDRLIGK
ncbi:MAG: hypothetical protein HYU70_16325 [Bacteroidetes bacterium]|nr:hypothetical protein [Bacteroidota bacterium]